MATFELTTLSPDNEIALETLARLTRTEISVKKTIQVTVENDELGPIVEKILGRPAQFIIPDKNTRNCEKCGRAYNPRRVDQKYCTDAVCQAERQKEYNKKTTKKVEEVPAEPAPLAQ